jgi:hypothetical protein
LIINNLTNEMYEKMDNFVNKVQKVELDFKEKLKECIHVELMALDKLINKMQGTLPVWKPKKKYYFNLN